MDHFFTLRNSRGTQLFLPISSVLKDGNASTPAAGMTGHNIRRSKSENDSDVSPLVLESLRLVPTHDNRSSYVQALCSPPGPAAPSYNAPVGGRNALSSSYPAMVDSSYGSGHKDNRYRSHSYDSISDPPGHPYSQQYQSTHVASHAHVNSNPYNLTVGSVILYGNPSRSGVIRWMGYPIGVNSFSAGIEMV